MYHVHFTLLLSMYSTPKYILKVNLIYFLHLQFLIVAVT